VEKALGATRTNELAVMWDTFRPLRLTTLWQQHDNPDYAYSWNEDIATSTEAVSPDGAAIVTGPSA
jgi:homogentisate 1,2-dioxygenase